MRTESDVRPVTVEKYPKLTRVNLGVSEVVRGSGEESVTMFSYYMVEIRGHIDYSSLVSLLILEKYSMDDQIAILANMDDVELQAFMDWRRECKSVARQTLGLEETLEQAKDDKLYDLTIYDKSSAVNECFVNGMSVWFDAVERVKIKNGIESSIRAGLTEYIVNFNGIPVSIECQVALDLFAQLELYAVKCYNVTAEHKYTIINLTSIEDVKSYDFSVNYPEKLNFEVTF